MGDIVYKNIPWLPPPVDFTLYKDQVELVHDLYKIFEIDFKSPQNYLYFDNRQVGCAPLLLYYKCEKFLEQFDSCENEYQCKNCPYVMYEDIFNHLTCRDFKKSNFRTPGIFEAERAKRINWIRPIIENVSSPEVYYYKVIIDGVLKHGFWLKTEYYAVFISEDAQGRLFLNTGYYLYNRKGADRINRDYKRYKANPF